MRNSICRLCLLTLIAISFVKAEGLLDRPLAGSVIDTLVSEHGFEREALEALFAEGEYIARNVENLANPAEKTKTYREYRPMFISQQKVANGHRFMAEHERWLDKAEQRTGVAAEVVAAILGVETHFGGFLGQHRTFDALATLALTEGRRAEYFQRELVNFLLISRDQGFDPLSVVGSYAGAMGYPQFMPSSYLAYAVDLDEDGDINIWDDPVDAIGSIANYLGEHGWRSDQPIATRARVDGDYQNVTTNSFERDQTLEAIREQGWEPLQTVDDPEAQVHPIRLDGEQGAEFWVGYRNFWVISRYNRSIVYTMAIFQLADELGRPPQEDAE